MGSDVVGLAPEVRQDSREAVAPREALDLSIVIVGYNSREPLGECLASIRDHPSRASCETIVVDNESSDGTGDFIRENFPWVRLYENAANVGLAKAVNHGIAESRGRYVLALNPDIVVTEGSLDRLIQFMDEHEDAGIAGSKLLNTDGSLQYSCRRFYTFWTLLLRRTFLGKIFKESRALRDYLMLDYDHEESREVDWIIGACMFVRKRALDAVGLMDERFFLYFEDVDWCFRIWRGGWKVYYVADSVMRHRYARESARPGLSRQLLMHVMSLFLFYEKWGKVIYAVKKYRRVVLRTVLLLSDLVAINLGFALAYLLRSSLKGLLEKPMFGVEIYAPFLVFANIVFVVSFAFFGLYDARSGREPGSDLFLKVLRAAAVSAIIMMASTFLTSQTLYSMVLVGTFSVLTVVLVTALRMLPRTAHRHVRAGRFDLKRVAIVGTGETAERIARRLVANSELGYDLAGLVATGDEPRSTGFPVIGKLEDLPRLIDELRVGEVVFAEPELSHDEIADFLLTARRSTVDVKMVSGLTGILTQRARVEEFLDLPVVSFEREALLRAGAGAKRAIDFVLAGCLLVLWSPFLALTALATATRGGPLSKTERAGLDTKPYDMYTLRPTERPSALRRFVDRHGLSRFPAVVNVWNGEMSFVGPEPVEPSRVDEFGRRERVRFDARPGLTGPSQTSLASGGADGSPAALEVYYVQNWSLGGDVKILLRWIGRCLGGRCSC